MKAMYISYSTGELYLHLGDYTCLFVDDIIYYSKTEEDHIRHLRQICKTLQQHKLFLNPDKCTFCQPEIVYLGNRVGRYGIRPTEDRVAALQNWPTFPSYVLSLASQAFQDALFETWPRSQCH